MCRARAHLGPAAARAPTVDSRAPTVDSRAPTVDSRAPTVDSRAPTVDSRARMPATEDEIIDFKMRVDSGEYARDNFEFPRTEVVHAYLVMLRHELTAPERDEPGGDLSMKRYRAEDMVEALARVVTEDTPGLDATLAEFSTLQRTLAEQPPDQWQEDATDRLVELASSTPVLMQVMRSICTRHDDPEVQRQCEWIYTICKRRKAAAAALEAYAAAMDEAAASMVADEEQKVVMEVREKLLSIASRYGYRHNKEKVIMTELRVPGTGRKTYCWMPCKDPCDRTTEYTIQRFVQYETGPERNRDLNLLLDGHVTGGRIQQVWCSLEQQPAVAFKNVDAYRHAFAFRDGIYIGFLHGAGAHGGTAFRNLWRAIERRAVHCVRNFGREPELVGVMSHRRRGHVVAADVFLTYEQADAFLPPTFTCHKFFDQPAHQSMGAEGAARSVRFADWYDIATPTVQYVMDCQWGDPGAGVYDHADRVAKLQRELHCDDLAKHARDTARAVYALLGRLFFPVDSYSASSGEPEMDSRLDVWHAAMVFKGQARTGKSSFGLLVKEYMHSSEVASISNRAEEIFGLEGLIDKHLAMCLEVKKDFNMDTAVLQQMITGETVSVARKFQTQQNDRNWTTPLLFACNELADSWDDAKGALTRRLIVIDFPFPVPSRDEAPVRINGDLHTHVHKSPECAAMLRKMYCAYMHKLDDCGDRDLVLERPSENVKGVPQQAFDGYPLPKGIHMWIRRNSGDMNIMRTFLLDENQIVRAEYNDFIAVLTRFGFTKEVVDKVFEAMSVIPFSAAVTAATAYVRENGKKDRDKQTRTNHKDLQMAIDDNIQCKLSYVDAGEPDLPTHILDWNEPDPAMEGSLLKPTPATGRLVRGGTLRTMLVVALDRAKAAGVPTDAKTTSAGIRMMASILTSCHQRSSGLLACANALFNDDGTEAVARPPGAAAAAGGGEAAADVDERPSKRTRCDAMDAVLAAGMPP